MILQLHKYLLHEDKSIDSLNIQWPSFKFMEPVLVKSVGKGSGAILWGGGVRNLGESYHNYHYHNFIFIIT